MRLYYLDGTTWDKAELIETMRDDNFYYGYLSQAALSSSSLKLLLDSPKTYKFVTQYGNDESQALRDGWLFHTAILEPEVFSSQVFVDVASKNTKAFREAKEEHGKVFTMTEKKDAERIADAFLRNTKAVELIRDCEFEVPMIGDIMGFPFRGKADVLGKNRIVDLKSTTDIRAFPLLGYANILMKYSAIFIANLFGIDYKDFVFLAVDKKSLDIAIYHCSQEFYHAGEQKVEAALEVYDTYFLQAADLDQYYLEGIL
jgi:hypothetical protein